MNLKCAAADIIVVVLGLMWPCSAETVTTTLTYDQLHRVSSVTHTGRTSSYSYDSSSNLLSRAVTGEGTAPTVSGLADDPTPTQSKTWSWNAGRAQVWFRYAIDQDPNGVPAGGYSDVTSATQPDGDGTRFLHVQAIDDAGNESDVVTVSAVLDNTAPVVPGLSDDSGPVQNKAWEWAATDADSVISYRYVVSQDSDAAPAGDYSDVTTAAKADGDGRWYIHVQARDRAGNESTVASAYVELDNTAPSITGLADDDMPTQSKTWNWGGGREVVSYRYVIDQNAGGMPTGDYSNVITATQPDGDGVYYLHVQTIDDAGNESDVVTVAALLDNTAPSVAGLADDPGPVQSTVWNWSAIDADSVISYRHRVSQYPGVVPAGDYDDVCSAAKADVDGTWCICVQARDRAGNESTIAGAYVNLDNTPPAIAGLADDNVPTKSKTWSWGITNEQSGPPPPPSPEYWSGTGSWVAPVEHTTYRYVIDQSPYSVPSGDYGDVVSATQPDGDGVFLLHVQAIDAAGNESDVVTVSAVLDNTAPVVTGLTDDAGPVQSKTWAWSATDNIDSTVSYRHLVGQDPDAVPDGEFTDVTTATKADGDNRWYIRVQATDRAGNESTVVGAWVELDNTAPSVIGLVDDDVPTRSKTWSWDTTGELLTYRYLLDRDPDSVPTGDYGGVTTATQPDGEGLYYLHTQAKDVAGNESEVVTVSAVLDNIAPVVTGLTDDAGPVQSKTWQWSATDADNEISYRYTVDQYPTGIPDGDYTEADTEGKVDAEGVWFIHVQATDRAGNASEVVTVSALLDNTAPIVTGLADDPGPVQSAVWNWLAIDADSGISYRYTVNQQPDDAPTGDYGDVTTATKADGDGRWYIHVQARDRAGNESTVATAYVNLDNTAPSVTGLANDDVPTQSKTWIWGSTREQISYRYVIDQSLDGTPAGAYGDVTSATQPDGDGIFYLHVQAIDDTGNESTVSTVSAILDNTAPKVTGLEDDAGPVQGKTWQWGSIDTDATISYRHIVDQDADGIPAGDYNAVNIVSRADADGMWYIHVQATDTAGNAGAVVTVSVLLDNTPPSFTWYWLTAESVEVVFSEPVIGAEDPFHYEFEPYLGIPSTGANGTKYRLITEPRSFDGVYSLCVPGITDLAGNLAAETPVAESGVLLRIHAPGAQNPELTFGQIPVASDGLDTGVDEFADEPEDNMPYVCLVGPQGNGLARDFRGGSDICRWRLFADVPQGRDALTVTWDIERPDCTKVVYLQEISEEFPRGRPVDMAETKEITISDSMEFEIVLSEPEQHTVQLAAGWNLVGSPLMSLQSIADIFGSGSTGEACADLLWQWANGQYQQCHELDPFEAESVRWVYCATSREAAPVTGVRADGTIVLKPGWNLVTPTVDCVMPVVKGIVGPLWSWVAGAYEAVPAGGVLQTGEGYWLFFSSDEPVVINLGEEN